MILLLLIGAMTFEEVGRPRAVGIVLTAKATTLKIDGQKPRRLEMADVVHPGEKLSVAADGEAKLYFSKDGHRERLKSNAEVVVGELGCSPSEVIERLMVRKLSAANTEKLHEFIQSRRSAVGFLRDGELPADISIVTPIYGATVLSDQPSFTWVAVPGADEYEFVLMSGNEKSPEKAWAAKTREPRLDYPANVLPLSQGLTYRWCVSAHIKNEWKSNVVKGKLSTPTQDESDELRQLDELIASGDSESLLLAAAVYEAHSIYDSAWLLYRRLAELAPEQANIHTALASYERRVGYDRKSKPADERSKQSGEAGP